MFRARSEQHQLPLWLMALAAVPRPSLPPLGPGAPALTGARIRGKDCSNSTCGQSNEHCTQPNFYFIFATRWHHDPSESQPAQPCGPYWAETPCQHKFELGKQSELSLQGLCPPQSNYTHLLQGWGQRHSFPINLEGSGGVQGMAGVKFIQYLPLSLFYPAAQG